MDQAFDALLQFNESAVVGHADDAAMDARADRVALGGVQPGVGRQLLEAQGNPLLVAIELQNLYLDLVADVDQVTRMGQPAPAHIGDMQQAVDAAQVHERAVIGQVLHRAGQHRVLLQVGHRDVALGGDFLIQNLLAADHDVAALLVHLDDADFQFLALQGIQVPDRANVDLGARQKCARAENVHRQTTLDAVDDPSFNGSFVVVSFFDLVPGVQTLRLLVGEIYVALLRVALFDHYVDGVAGLELHVTVVVLGFFQGHNALGFQANIHHQVVAVDANHRALEDAVFVSGEFGLLLLERLECCCEIFRHVFVLWVAGDALGRLLQQGV